MATPKFELARDANHVQLSGTLTLEEAEADARERRRCPARGGGREPGRRARCAWGALGSAASLKERIMHRDSAHEVGFYEARRWTERPALGDALRAAVLRISDDVVSDLRATTAAPPTCSPLPVTK